MSTPASRRMTGVARVLVVVYAIMALASTGRSFVQLVSEFDAAPLAYLLSGVSAVVYIVATLALVFSDRPGWYVTAWVAIGFELVGVLVIGTLSIVLPELFQHPTVWSLYGDGYVFVPLVLPFVGLGWLWSNRPGRVVASEPVVSRSSW